MIHLFIFTFATFTRGDIPRACSTPETDKFPFCDTRLSLDERIKDLISRIHLEEKPYLLTARESPKGNISRIGLPEFDWGTNCIHGVQSRCGKNCPTSFPNPNGLGATFNRTLYRAMGAIIGMELRALWLEGVGENHMNNLPHLGLDCWSPNINVLRDPRWGRALETTGEDPFLNGVFGVEYTRGLQEGSSDTVQDSRYLLAVVTLKHWDAYSLEGFWGPGNNISRHNFDAIVSEFDYRSSYTPAFKMSVIKGNAKGVMCSYNSVNGVPSCMNEKLFKTLRGEWGFEGYVTSDSNAITDIQHMHHYTETLAEASVAAISVGCDVDSCLGPGCRGEDSADMTGSPYIMTLAQSVQNGTLKESVIDAALYNTLKLRFQLGLFDPIEDQPYWHVSPDAVASELHNQTSLEATRQTMTLLQNPSFNGFHNILPLHKESRIALLGPHINAKEDLVGNYLGEFCHSDHFDSFDCIVSPMEYFQEYNPGSVVGMEACDNVLCNNDTNFAAAIDMAKHANVIVLMMGLNTKDVEKEGKDRKTLSLPGKQMDLIKMCLDLKKPVVLVLLNGGPVSLDGLVGDENIAILEAFYPSQYGAQAIVETLYGDNNPSGKLPFSTYSADYVNEVDFLNHDMVNDVGRTYRYYRGKYEQFAFGHGLSYTKFNFTKSLREDGHTSTVDVTVVNAGSLPGAETVQIYIKPADVDKMKLRYLRRQLVDFAKVSLLPGESQTVSFPLSKEQLTLYDDDGKEFEAKSYEVLLQNGNDWEESFVLKR